MLLSDAIEGHTLFRSTEVSESTLSTEGYILAQFIRYVGDIDIADITSDVVREYLVYHQDRGLSKHTLRRHHTTISALFAWLCSDNVGIATENPTASVARPKIPKTLPKAIDTEDIAKLVAVASETRNPRRDKSILLTLLDSGCRAGELCNIAVRDCHLKTGKILLRHAKGDKQRYVYLGKSALSALWLYLREGRPTPRQVGCDKVYLSQVGYPINRNTLRSIVVRLGERVGVKVSPHHIRHSAAIAHLRNGMSLAHLQHLLGHSSIVTTRRYTSALNDDDCEKVARRTSPVDNLRL